MVTAALLQNRSPAVLQAGQAAAHSLQEQSKALEKLRESEAKYRALVQQLPVITYIASLESPGKLLYVSPQISLLGYPPEYWLDAPLGLLKRVHKDDLDVTIEAYNHSYEHCAPLRCEYRLVKNDGTIRWILDEANVVRDENGQCLCLQGVLVDITKDKEAEQELLYYRQRLEELVVQRTEQLEKQCTILRTANTHLDKTLIELKQANSELRNSELRFRLLLESVGDGIVGLDAKGHCTFVNRSALAMLGYSKDEVLNQDIRSMLGQLNVPESVNSKDESWLHNLLRDCSIQCDIKFFNRKDGSRFLVDCTSYPIEWDGLIDSSVLVFRDATESQARIWNLAYQASHDPLTGLLNRNEFERRLTRVLADMHSDENSHALCFLDLDHFKNINDAYGHATGDHVLRTFSALLASKLRQRDTLARLGGDEFALLLEHTTLDQAICIANELCESVCTLNFAREEHEFSVSVSIGITSLARGDGNLTDVLSHADRACYEAKNLGRNQTYSYRKRTLNCIEVSVLND